MENRLGLKVEFQDGVYMAYHPCLEGIVATGKTPERAIANYDIFFEVQNIVDGDKNEK